MAKIIGISKKTLVEIEKERILVNWTTIIAVCALFKEREILQATLGDEPFEVVETIAHEEIIQLNLKSMGGKVWWREQAKQDEFR